jgi:hypothetical protein
MREIFIESIRHAVTQGTLIDLAGDYRTSRSIRACLPRQSSYPFAISATAFHQEMEPGTARDRQTRLDLVGAFLTKVIGLCQKPNATDLELRFPRETGNSNGVSLKAAWFAPDKYWVVLLPQEELRPMLKLA